MNTSLMRVLHFLAKALIGTSSQCGKVLNLLVYYRLHADIAPQPSPAPPLPAAPQSGAARS